MGKKAALQETETLSFQAYLDRQQQLEERIPKAKAEYQQVCGDVYKKRLSAEHARHEADTFRKEALDTNKRRGAEGLDAVQRDHLAPLVHAAENAEAEYQAADEWAENLNRELTALEQELEGLDCPLTAEQVLGYQAKLSEALAAVSALDSAIAAQEAVIRDSEAQVPSLIDRTREREDLLAEIAVGKATVDDLKRLDDSTDNERATIEAARQEASRITVPARQTIAGLSRKRDGGQANYDRIKGQVKRVYASFLEGEAGKNGAEYCAAAVTLVRCLRKASALHSLNARYGGKVLTNLLGERELFIPALPLDSCKDHTASSFHGQFKDAAEFRYRTPETALAAIDAERARINALGIEL
jgi:chromosome segregation ATPase